MKKYILLIIILLPELLFSQNEFSMQIVVRDNIGQFDRNFFGYKLNATNYLDDNKEIGEFELPNLSFPDDIMGAFNIQKKIINDEGLPALEDIYSYKDYKPYFNSSNDSIVFSLKIVHSHSDFNMLFIGNFPSDIKSAKVYSLEFPYTEYDLMNSKLVKVLYNKNFLSQNFKIVLKNSDDSTKVTENKADLNVYPNPSNDLIYFSEQVSKNIEIKNIYGQIFNRNIVGNSISLQDFPAGVYIVSGNDMNGKSFSKIVVKK